jgi:hypothetical protein
MLEAGVPRRPPSALIHLIPAMPALAVVMLYCNRIGRLVQPHAGVCMMGLLAMA